MEPLTHWQIFVNWLLEPWTWTQCRAIDNDGYYCQRRCWHRGEHRYFDPPYRHQSEKP